MERLDLLFQTYQLIDRVSRRKKWLSLKGPANSTYTIWRIVKLYLAIAWMGWTRNLFYDKLKLQGATIRRMLRLPQEISSYSQLKQRMLRPEFEHALGAILSESAPKC